MNWVREIVLNNLALKGLALLLAGLVWHQVTSREIIQRSVILPITFVNIPSGTEVLTNDSDRRAEVVLQSDRGSVVIDDRLLAVVVDLKPYRIGEEHLIPLRASNINRPSGVDVVGITPPRVRLKLEPTLHQTVTVEPQIAGEPAEGYEITAVEVRPAQITITGPESHVSKISSAPTGRVDVSGRSETFELSTFADLEDPRLRIENPAPLTVRVSIEEKRKDVRLRGVKLKVLPELSRAKLNVGQIDVEGSVPVSFSEKIDASAFQAILDISGLEVRSEPYQLAPRIVVPPKYESIFRLSRLTPPQIRVQRTR